MGKAEKLLAGMRANPRGDWRIEDCQTLARRHGVDWDTCGSHVTFRSPGGGRVTVPAHRPIKTVYIKAFVDLIDACQEV